MSEENAMKRHKWPLINWRAINLKTLVQPLLGVLLFLGLWQWGASQVQTSLGTLPGPLATASQFWSLGQDHPRAARCRTADGRARRARERTHPARQ